MKKYQSMEILLIEDNPGDARLIEEMTYDVQEHRLSVLHAGSLTEGLRRLADSTFDAVLLDIGLPDSSGLDSVQEIRAAAPEVPIIMLTGVHDEDTISSSLQMGAQDYLIKGRIDADLLVRAIRYSIERMRAYEAIESKQRFIERANNAMPDVLFIFDITAHKLVYANDKLESIFGYTQNEIRDMGQDLYQRLVYQDDLRGVYDFLSKLSLSGDEDVNDFEVRIRVPDGGLRCVHLRCVVFSRGEDGRTREVLGTARDITDRKEAESRIKASLHEKELLLREVHHRVKNNMMVITSLLKLQSRKISDRQYKNMFDESIHRIRSMALIHEKLYRAGDMSDIKFDEYLESLLNFIVMSYDITTRKISLKKDLGRISLSISDAIPCGLIVNELITNCLKYAFPGDDGGEIRISLSEIEELRLNNDDEKEKVNNHQSSIDNCNSTVELVVGDNGVGLPVSVDLDKADSLGLNMVHMLVKQIHGSIDILRDHGTEFRIRFRK